MIIIYLVPIKPIEKNVRNSIETFINENEYEHSIDGYHFTVQDNFTDALMIQNAIYNEKEGVIDKAIWIKRYVYDDATSPRHNLIVQFNGEVHNKEIVSYSRYWHGYLIILKPLLVLIDYNGIRILNSLIQPLLIFSIIYFLDKKKKNEYMIPYVCSILFISPITIAKSIQFSIIFYIFNIALLIMLIFNDRIKEKNQYGYFFLLIGITTSYFDLLTYPLASLGMPLALYFILNNHNKLDKNVKVLVKNSIMWGIGYIGMWIGKFAIGSLLTGKNLFINGFEQFKTRISFQTAETKLSILDSLKMNILTIINKPYIILAITLIIIIVIMFIRKKVKIGRKTIRNIIPFIIIMVMPFVWYIVTSNHSYIHAFFTYRVMIISVFAFLSSFVYIIEKNANINEKRGHNQKRKMI